MRHSSNEQILAELTYKNKKNEVATEVILLDQVRHATNLFQVSPWVWTPGYRDLWAQGFRRSRAQMSLDPSAEGPVGSVFMS